MTKQTVFSIFLMIFLGTSCSEYSLKKNETLKAKTTQLAIQESASFGPSRQLANTRMNYTDDLQIGDFVVVSSGCNWEDIGYKHIYYYFPTDSYDFIFGKLCFGKVTSVFSDNKTYNVTVTSGYQPNPNTIYNSYNEVQRTLRVDRAALSIPVSGFCIVDSEYCVGETVESEGRKVKIVGIFPDGTLALRGSGSFSYGVHYQRDLYKGSAYYYFKSNINNIVLAKNL